MDHRPPLDYDDAADYLNLTKRHLQSLVHRRAIPHVKVGRLIRFLPDQLDQWIGAGAVELSEGQVAEIDAAIAATGAGTEQLPTPPRPTRT